MTRSLGTNFTNALSADALNPFFAVKMDFAGGAVNLWGGYGNITIDGETYAGSADFLTISEIDETSEIKATGINVTLSGVPSALVSAALTDNYQGRDITVYFGTLTDAGAINNTPYVLFRGKMDVMSIQESGEQATINITGESRLIDLEIARERRYTSEDQKIDFPDDKGLEFVADLQDKQIIWGGR